MQRHCGNCFKSFSNLGGYKGIFWCRGFTVIIFEKVLNNYTLLNIIYQQKEALLGLSGDLDFRVKTMTEPFLLSLLLLF